MTAVADILPLSETRSPAEQDALAALVADAHAAGTAVYPIGGGTSLDYGLPASRPGIGVSLAKLNRVIDYPARDMTITVEAGITVEQLAGTLADERQMLPIDVPQAGSATLGGLVATAFSGPRRYGYGTMRDYVIGISAVDGDAGRDHANHAENQTVAPKLRVSVLRPSRLVAVRAVARRARQLANHALGD